MAYARRAKTRRSSARNTRRAPARSVRRTAVRKRAAPARGRAPARRSAPRRQQQMKIVVELAPTSQVGRPDIGEDALRSAQIENKKGRARL